MKKIFNISTIILMLVSFFFFPLATKAAVTYYGKSLAEDNLAVRKGPGTSYAEIGVLAYNTEVQLVSGSPATTKGCSGGWYQIYYNNSTEAYVCGSYLSITSKTTNNGNPSNDYEQYLANLGFPSSYWDYLASLHDKHPNWSFEPIQTKLDWSNSVAAESIVGVSLIQTKFDGWKSTAAGSYDPATNTFKVLEGSNWYAAAPGVVAYYMDPRNFLDEKHIFMFEKLSYDSSYQSENAVKSVFNGGSMGNYASNFVTAGSNNQVNPIYLASRVRQEVGSNVGDSRATTGEEFVYDGKTYKGLYNVYNIGATTGSSPVLKGLVWANGGSDGSDKSYDRPWTSIESSIAGGAKMIAESFINKGQYTNYLQRFNVDPNAYFDALTHPYMTNIQAVYSESTTTYDSYNKMNLLDNNFKFAIPIYDNMPDHTELPDTRFNPSTNNSQNNNTAPSVDTNGLINSLGLKTDGSYISGLYEGMSVDSLVTSLRNGGGNVSTNAHGNLATGDKITINNKTYTVILYGDLNSDAKINLADLVQSKKYFLGYNTLDNNDKEAADVNKDGKVTLADLVIMKKNQLKLTNIVQ